MTIRNLSLPWRALLFALLLVSCAFGSRAAESNTLRLAIGPFFAPVGNDSLRQATQVLPELLAAELSQVPRFQLVEREKIQAVWSELNLSASGLVGRDTVAKLGRVLACDWLVSGSFVQAGGRTHVWTKVIDVRSGVVLDLNAAPYEPGVFTNTVAGIAAFLAKAGAQPKGRQFIALGRFVDMNPPLAVKREDWSRRIAALIEKHFLEAGFGVVEIAAVGPIFEEQRLEKAGLTGHPERRVDLQAAFWLVDGGCEWVADSSDKLAIGLRVQKIGGPEQMFHLTELAGDDVEKSVIATLTRALADTNLVTQSAPNAEADLLAARGMELATRRSPFEPKMAKTRTQWDVYKQALEQKKRVGENRNASIATYERTLLRDPKNLEAKSMLGYALLGDLEPARRERGKELLREVVASKDPKYARRANSHLANAELYARTIAETANFPTRPNDWDSLEQALAENPGDLEAKCGIGALLLKTARASDNERGRKLLAEVISGDRPDQVERARKLLAPPEKTVAVVSQPASPTVVDRQVAVKPPHSIPRLAPEQDTARERRIFLQQQFARFVPVSLEKDGSQFAKIQRLPVKGNTFDYQGQHYCGFRFTAPASLDGDLKWMHILAKTEAQKDFSTKAFAWSIVPKFGRMKGFDDCDQLAVADYAHLKERFPHTRTVFQQTLSKESLEPGQEYAICFRFAESDLPDIAFALTIQSTNGYNQFGILPLQ